MSFGSPGSFILSCSFSSTSLAFALNRNGYAVENDSVIPRNGYLH